MDPFVYIPLAMTGLILIALCLDPASGKITAKHFFFTFFLVHTPFCILDIRNEPHNKAENGLHTINEPFVENCDRVNLLNDKNNCGICGTTCPNRASCSNGHCAWDVPANSGVFDQPCTGIDSNGVVDLEFNCIPHTKLASHLAQKKYHLPNLAHPSVQEAVFLFPIFC